MAAKKRAEPDFRKGDRVGHSNMVYMYTPSTVIYEDSLPPGSKQGTVLGPGSPGCWTVQLDGDDGVADCTTDSLVKIAKAR